MVYDCLVDWYHGSNVVHMGAAANHSDVPPLLAADGLAGRNDMELFVFSDTVEKRFWMTARLDNLGKGGAFVQNVNIALGLNEILGSKLTQPNYTRGILFERFRRKGKLRSMFSISRIQLSEMSNAASYLAPISEVDQVNIPMTLQRAGLFWQVGGY